MPRVSEQKKVEMNQKNNSKVSAAAFHSNHSKLIKPATKVVVRKAGGSLGGQTDNSNSIPAETFKTKVLIKMKNKKPSVGTVPERNYMN